MIKSINRFIYTPYYMLLIALLMAASNIFALEFFVFYVYMGFCIWIVLFAPDTFPIMPMFCCGYMLFSAKNNPAQHYGENFLSSPSAKYQFVLIAVIVFLALATRFAYELVIKKQYRRRLPKLTYGFLILCVAYVLAGLFSEYYSMRTVLFGLLQVVSLCLTYYFFYYTVDWQNRSGKDVAFVLCTVGIGLALEIAGMYCTPKVLDAIINNKFQRDLLISGWGVYNNVGGMAAIFVPVPFYLAATHKRHAWWLLLACFFMAAVIFTQSRGAMMAGGAVFALCCVLVLVFSKGKTRLWNALMLLSIFAVLGILLFGFFEDDLLRVFSFFEKNEFFDSNSRAEVYEYGWERFCKKPVFGSGFYIGEEDIPQYQHGYDKLPSGVFMPPRYHNTYIQLLASGGVLALAAYLFHRLQTILLIIKRRTPLTVFFGLAILTIVISSLVDCHFFNFGPGLTYGVILVCMENVLTDRDTKAVQKG